MLPDSYCRWLIEYEGEPRCIFCGFTLCEFANDPSKCNLQKYQPFDPNLQMKICEIYPAISGEGSSTGRVCTIVRTVGCNLRCLYCDSQYAYEGGTEIATKDVLDVILKYGIKTVLFTGGEPLLEEKIASNFLRAMLENQIVTYVETNGSIDIRPFKLLAHMVMDVKTPSSGMHEKMEWNNMSYIGPMDEIKFVVSNREDYDYAKQVVEKYKLFNSTSNIFVSPVWTDDKKFFQELSSWMIQDRSEARLMVQQHKVIWGSVKRSV